MSFVGDGGVNQFIARLRHQLEQICWKFNVTSIYSQNPGAWRAVGRYVSGRHTLIFQSANANHKTMGFCSVRWYFSIRIHVGTSGGTIHVPYRKNRQARLKWEWVHTRFRSNTATSRRWMLTRVVQILKKSLKILSSISFLASLLYFHPFW